MQVKKRLLSRVQSYIRVKKAEKSIRNAYDKGQVSVPFGPSSLNLMMIDSCNSQCIMCGKDYQACGTMEYLSLKDMETICSHLDMSQIVDVIYGGGGEPFLNPDLASIASLIHNDYPVIQHTVISNFIQCKENTVSSMLDDGVHFLISINAASSATYQKISGVDAFDAVTDHVRRLVRMRDEKKASINIALSIVLMEQNIEELVEFVKLAKELGADEVKTLYARIYPEEYRQRQNNSNTIVPQNSLFYHQEQSDLFITNAEKVARKISIKFDHEPLFACSNRIDRNCSEPWKSLFINFNGDVYPCPASEILFKPKVDGGEYQSGNILKEDIAEFWNNDFWQKLRESNRPNERADHFKECLCCGNSINWWGTGEEKAHVLDWDSLKHR